MTNTILILALLAAIVPAVASADSAGRPRRPGNTYSIVARDPDTGEIGAAVQSHWFSVGADVIWAEPGIGAVATQSFVDPALHKRTGIDARHNVPLEEHQISAVDG